MICLLLRDINVCGKLLLARGVSLRFIQQRVIMRTFSLMKQVVIISL